MKNREIQPREGAPSWTLPPGIRVIVPADEWMPWVEVDALCAHLGIRVPDTLRAKAKTNPNLEFGTVDGVEFATASTAFRLFEAASADPLFHPFMALLYMHAMPNLVRFASGLPAVSHIDGPSRTTHPSIDDEMINESGLYYMFLCSDSTRGREVLSQWIEGGLFRRFLTGDFVKK
ncbi:MAG TPA: hypothetical protein DEQ43_09730 [Nocardioides bacterium]|mgnify:CR=1 FL=1|nr:hypothetical protein [Nocardioides sp.]